MSKLGDDEELLTAYLDGVAELTPDERKRVELRLERDPDFKREADELRAVLDQARASAASSVEPARDPDWSALERQIREAVGPTVPMPWWRRMRWLAPISTLATTAAIALIWLHHAPADHATLAPRDAGNVAIIAAPAPAPAPPEAAKPTTMYIDGQVIDISNVDPEALVNDGTSDNTAAGNELLPAADYGWIDQLDDKAMDRAERWLATRKKG
ncbi:MAG TPA: hypothetical protein VGG28_18875 [Kofleriaceae bacterium]|jgi:anti-sigma factor RsiW